MPNSFTFPILGFLLLTFTTSNSVPPPSRPEPLPLTLWAPLHKTYLLMARYSQLNCFFLCESFFDFPRCPQPLILATSNCTDMNHAAPAAFCWCPFKLWAKVGTKCSFSSLLPESSMVPNSKQVFSKCLLAQTELNSWQIQIQFTRYYVSGHLLLQRCSNTEK